MKISLKQGLVIAVTGTLGMGAGVMIAAGTGILGTSAEAGAEVAPLVEDESSKSIDALQGASAEVLSAYKEAELDPTDNRTNEIGKTYGTGSTANSPEELPDLVAVWVDSETIGFIPREVLYPEIFETKENQLESNPQGIQPDTFTAYKSDGVTVITDDLKLNEG